MSLEVSWDSLWMLFFGFSQFHGHNSHLICEVALMCGHYTCNYIFKHLRSGIISRLLEILLDLVVKI